MQDATKPEPSRPPLPARKELVELLLSQMRDYALFFTTPDGTIVDWYPGAEHIFGWSAEEMTGESIRRIFIPEDLARGMDRHEMEIAASVGRAEDDRWHLRKDGTRIWASGMSVAIRGPDGELLAFAKLVRNRTDVKAQTEALEADKAALDRKVEHAATFLAILGHELRNPLTPIANALHLLKHADGDKMVLDRAVQVVDRQVAVMSRLVEDIMDVTRATTGKVNLQLSRLDLREVLAVVVEAARAEASSRSQALQLVTAHSAIEIDGDADRLQQVFSNLVNNAIKYTQPGGKILVNAGTEGGDAVIRIEDNGMGMDADVLPHVFELFTQERRAGESSRGGVGLGLPLVRELVRAHGGTVQARSDGCGKGSTFTVRLPLPAAKQP